MVFWENVWHLFFSMWRPPFDSKPSNSLLSTAIRKSSQRPRGWWCRYDWEGLPLENENPTQQAENRQTRGWRILELRL